LCADITEKMSENAEKPADDLASESGESEAMETDPGALEEGQRLLDMESPSKRNSEASTPQELAAKITSARNKISKLGRSEISKINIVPDPQAAGSPGEPSKSKSDKTERILTEPVGKRCYCFRIRH
jgi:hypothetical protein